MKIKKCKNVQKINSKNGYLKIILKNKIKKFSMQSKSTLKQFTINAYLNFKKNAYQSSDVLKNYLMSTGRVLV